MPTTRWSRTLRPALGAALIAALGCSSEPSAPGGTPSLSQAEADAAADVVVSDLQNQTEGAAAASSASPDFYATSTGAGGSASFAVTGFYATRCTPAPTVTVNGSTTTYVFDHCTISRPVPPETIVRNGEVDLTLEPGLRIVVFKDFEKTWTRISFRTGAEITTSETRNGTRRASDDGTTLSLDVYGLGDPATSTFRTDYVHPDNSTSQHLRNWHSIFTADAAGSLVHDQPLPAGSWAITGTGTWIRNPGSSAERSWTFTTTATGVHYNPACTAAPQFDAGTLTVTAVNRQTGITSTFTVTFTDCGKYTVTITRSNA